MNHGNNKNRKLSKQINDKQRFVHYNNAYGVIERAHSLPRPIKHGRQGCHVEHFYHTRMEMKTKV